MTWAKGVSGNPLGRKKSHTKAGKVGYTSTKPDQPCPICGVIIKKHPRCPLCDILVGPGHEVEALEGSDYCRRVTRDDLNRDGIFLMLEKMVTNLRSNLRSAREQKRALAYVRSGDWAQWAELVGVSASDARDALVNTPNILCLKGGR